MLRKHGIVLRPVNPNTQISGQRHRSNSLVGGCVCMSMWTQLTKNNILQPYLEDVIIYLTKVFSLNNGHLCGSLMIELLLNIFYFRGWKKIKIKFFFYIGQTLTHILSFPVYLF